MILELIFKKIATKICQTEHIFTSLPRHFFLEGFGVNPLSQTHLYVPCKFSQAPFSQMLGFSMHSFMSTNYKFSLVFLSISFKTFLNLDRDYLVHYKYYTNTLKFCHHFITPLLMAKLKSVVNYSMRMIVSKMYW